MTDIEIKLKEHEERLKKIENRVFGMWMDQYEPEYDISDPEPYIPVAACSQEAMYEAMRKHDEWEQRHNANNFRIT